MSSRLAERLRAAFGLQLAAWYAGLFVLGSLGILGLSYVLLARSLWRALRDLHGEEGARAVLTANPELVNELRIVATPPADIDTPADYEEATKQAAAGGRAS